VSGLSGRLGSASHKQMEMPTMHPRPARAEYQPLSHSARGPAAKTPASTIPPIVARRALDIGLDEKTHSQNPQRPTSPAAAQAGTKAPSPALPNLAALSRARALPNQRPKAAIGPYTRVPGRPIKIAMKRFMTGILERVMCGVTSELTGTWWHCAARRMLPRTTCGAMPLRARVERPVRHHGPTA